jgi:hypothetical protein
MVKLVARCIRDDVMETSPLHQNKFPYQRGKSTETVLHNITTQTRNAMEHKIALEAFPDIGATERTSFKLLNGMRWRLPS